MDVKYKTPDSKDHYQLFTYMKYAQTDVAYIISPAVEHGQTITAFDGSKIVYIQIDTSDFDELERIAEQTIRDLIWGLGSFLFKNQILLIGLYLRYQFCFEPF